MTPMHSSKTHFATTALVADQSRRGLTIIPTGTPLTRLNFFDGKFLRADDFRLEQSYERALVALTARGAGSGVVHGFELITATADANSATLRAGLAISPSGRAIHLPIDATLSIIDLVERSDDTFDPRQPNPGANTSFDICDPVSAPEPDITVETETIYVVTIAPDEALCGEEERFDQLCADACLTETDRPRRVEGVRVRARRIELRGLPTSNSVLFTALHLRSRIASAYFASERQQVMSGISASGLASTIWRDGAEAANGDEVPIAVIGRSGGVTTLLDLWTARREMMEPPTQRYWAGRMSGRPWDVFLAHVLQFQSQLRENRSSIVADGLVGGGIVELPSAGYLPVDPEQAIPEQLRALMGEGVDLRFCVAPSDHIPELLEQARHMDRISLTRGLDDVALRAPVDIVVPDGTLTTPTAAPTKTYTGVVRLLPRKRRVKNEDESGSALVLNAVARDLSDNNSVSNGLPSSNGVRWAMAAYGEAPQGLAVERLVVALLGKAGLGKAGLGRTGRSRTDSERTDLVGRGAERSTDADEAERAAVFITADEIHAKRVDDPSTILRANRERELAKARRSSLLLNWAELGRDVPGRLRPTVDRPIEREEARPIATWFDIDISSRLVDARPGDIARTTMRFSLYSRASTDPVLTDVKLDGTLRVLDRVDQAGRFDGVTQTEINTVFDGFIDPLVVSPSTDGDQPPVAVRAKIQWRFSREGEQSRLVAMVSSDGFLPTFEMSGTSEMVKGTLSVRPPSSLQPKISKRRRTAARETAADRIRETARDNITLERLGLVLDDTWDADDEIAARPSPFPAPFPTPSPTEPAPAPVEPVPGESTPVEPRPTEPVATVIAAFAFRRDDHALDTGRPERDLATTAIESIGAELARPDRDPDFVVGATNLLLGDGSSSAPPQISATRDWVLFTRRRTIQCADEVAPSVGTRSYVAYHATIDDPAELSRFLKLLDVYARGAHELVGESGLRAATVKLLEEKTDLPYLLKRVPIDDLGLERVGVVQFPGASSTMQTSIDQLREVWSSQDRGSKLLWQAGGDAASGDGEAVILQRLANYRGAISSLIDTTEMQQPYVLPNLPDDLVSPGTDGVILTVGLASPRRRERVTKVR